MIDLIRLLKRDDRYSMAYLYGGTVEEQIDAVKRTNNAFDTVSPSYFDLNDDGTLRLNEVSQKLLDYMHSNDIKVVPFLSNHWNREAGINALRNSEGLSSQIANIVQYYNLDGVNVDIENLTEQQRDQYTEFVRQLREKIPAYKEVSVAVAANPNNLQFGWHGSYDYTALANNSDYLMIMTYDEHYEGGTPGPVASIEFVEESIKYALSKTTNDKIVVGLPLFGRIWSEDNTNVVGKGIPRRRVEEIIEKYDAVVTYDVEAQSPKVEFEIREGDKEFILNGTA